MRIIYEICLEGEEDKEERKESFIFDNYEAIETFLEKYCIDLDGINNIRITTLAKCDNCEEYSNVEFYSLIKKDNFELNAYCRQCSFDFLIDKKKYIKR